MNVLQLIKKIIFSLNEKPATPSFTYFILALRADASAAVKDEPSEAAAASCDVTETAAVTTSDKSTILNIFANERCFSV